MHRFNAYEVKVSSKFDSIDATLRRIKVGLNQMMNQLSETNWRNDIENLLGQPEQVKATTVLKVEIWLTVKFNTLFLVRSHLASLMIFRSHL